MPTFSDKAQSAGAFILNQRTSNVCGTGPVLFQESRLALSSDLERIVLVRYIEHYSPECEQWVEYSHSVSVAELTQWLMANGQLNVVSSDGSAGA